eukprot:3014260-Prymnesium_polylepis.1
MGHRAFLRAGSIIKFPYIAIIKFPVGLPRREAAGGCRWHVDYGDLAAGTAAGGEGAARRHVE